MYIHKYEYKYREKILKMPAYYDMVISQSPPVFSHSPPTSFLSDFGSNNFAYYDPPKFCRPQVLSPLQSRRSFPPPQGSSVQKNRNLPKSCLVNRQNGNELQEDSNKIKNAERTKKKVVFADDQGRSLTEVRVMSEPSYAPPFWSLQYLAQITQGFVSPVPTEQWTVDFRQPASNYLQFREKVEKKNVSLENVIVKENESIIVGTVKVKNVHFQKEVIVRVTWDNWKSQQDIYCTYSEIYGPSTAYVIFDTFSFKVTLPPSSKKLEFCICFRADGQEFWDNNNGANYTISKRSPNSHQSSTDALLRYEKVKNGVDAVNGSPVTISKPIGIPSGKKSGEEFTSKVSTWSDPSSWNQESYPSPYW